jgi:hypothetical protein
MELGSIMRIRLVAAEFVEADAVLFLIELVGDDFVCNGKLRQLFRVACTALLADEDVAFGD